MRKTLALGTVVLALTWCGTANGSRPPEVEEALAIAAGTYPIQSVPYSASSGYSLLVESVTIQPGDTGTVGLYLTNDTPIRAFNIPLIIRSVDPGSYMTSLFAGYNPDSRLNGYLNGEFHDTIYFQPIINTYPYYGEIVDSRGYHLMGLYRPPAPPDYISPDGLLFARFRIMSENNLPAGNDGVPGDGIPMMIVRLRVNDIPGRFEIDTSFTEPAHHLMFLPGDNPVRMVAPGFTKGIITIAGDRESFVYEDTLSTGNDSTYANPPDDTVDDSANVNPPSDSTATYDPWNDDAVADSNVVGDWPYVIVGPNGDTLQPLDTLTAPWAQDTMKTTGNRGGAAPIDAVSNYPNPFNAATTIRYSLDGSRKVTVAVYDLLGRTVATLVDAYQSPGDYNIPWEGRDAYGHSVPAGIYFYLVQQGDFKTVGKMVLLK